MQENKQEEQEWRILHGKLTNDGGHKFFSGRSAAKICKAETPRVYR